MREKWGKGERKGERKGEIEIDRERERENRAKWAQSKPSPRPRSLKGMQGRSRPGPPQPPPPPTPSPRAHARPRWKTHGPRPAVVEVVTMLALVPDALPRTLDRGRVLFVVDNSDICLFCCFCRAGDSVVLGVVGCAATFPCARSVDDIDGFQCSLQQAAPHFLEAESLDVSIFWKERINVGPDVVPVPSARVC